MADGGRIVHGRNTVAADFLEGKWVRIPLVSEAFNYFNYFTEVEEYFWKKRGAHLLVSPLDWAIVETWQKAGIPVEAVLKGIDRAFESYARSKRGAGGRTMKSLAYCVDSVLEAAEEAREAAVGKGAEPATAAKPREAFSRDELRAYFSRNAERLLRAAEKQSSVSPETAGRLRETSARLAEMLVLLDSPAKLNLEDVERRLTVLEERLHAALLAGGSEEVLLGIRREMDRALAPYRRRMTAEQLERLERQYMHKRLLEAYEAPRLSLFYLT
jgi:hypothetical protein